MEAIKNYLETMFATLPNTPEVLKAKFELEQMMEDKYTELKNEGKTENEALQNSVIWMSLPVTWESIPMYQSLSELCRIFYPLTQQKNSSLLTPSMRFASH